MSEILPALELGININVSSKKAEEAVITGVSADLSCPQKNIVIKKTNDKGNLIDVNIAKDFKAKASIDLLFGNAEVKFPADADTYNYTIGAINLSASGSLEINKQVQMSLLGILNIDVPADTYKLDVAIAADPAKLVELDFTGIHSTPHAIDVAIEAVTSAVDYLNLKITKANGSTFLQLELKKQNNQLVLGDISLTALGLPAAISNILSGGKSIQAIWSSLSNLEIGGSKLINLGDGLDPGYVYKNGVDYKGGYKVDTANGYVDKDEDDNPDKDANGNFVVNTDAGYELYKGRPWKKSDLPCYNADGSVRTDAGYTETKRGSGQVKYNDDGDFAPASGYVLAWVEVSEDLWMNLPMKQSEYDELHKNDPVSDEGLIPSTVKDLIAGLSLVAKNGQISVTLGGLSLCVNEDEVKESEEAHKIDESVAVKSKKYATLAATLNVDKNGIVINGNVKGLDGLA
ncbi:MAG: hypothetical protein K2J13_00130, partial [Clostridia bacterium]|nr:hypothetical protein [Clostridia bacterium]